MTSAELGRTRHEGVAALQRLLAALARLALTEDDAWAETARRAQREWLAVDGNREAALHLDGIWQQAVVAAEADPAIAAHSGVSLTLPQTCPVPAELLGADALDVETVTRLIRESAATG